MLRYGMLWVHKKCCFFKPVSDASRDVNIVLETSLILLNLHRLKINLDESLLDSLT